MREFKRVCKSVRECQRESERDKERQRVSESDRQCQKVSESVGECQGVSSERERQREQVGCSGVKTKFKKASSVITETR